MKLELNKDVEKALHHVKISKPINLGYFPDFLIVGPQRTGTTWLHSNLVGHPEIFLSKRKEIYFFNALNNPKHRKYVSSELSWYLRHFKDTPITYLEKMIKCLFKYGEKFNPLVRGEATASYAVLREDVINEIILLNPNIKIIVMARNPIDRAWSHANKDLVRNANKVIEDVPSEDFYNFFNDKYQVSCGRYINIIEKWERLLPKGNFFLGFFDDVSADPEKLLQDIYNFLGVNSSNKYLPKNIGKVINPTKEVEIPVNYRSMLSELFADEIIRMNKRYNLNWIA